MVFSCIFFDVTTDGFSDDKRECSFRKNSKASRFTEEGINYWCRNRCVKTIDRFDFSQGTSHVNTTHDLCVGELRSVGKGHGD